MSDSAPDYYIRRSDSDEVRGPFNLDKLATLAEAGKIDRDTLYYDEEKQDWIPLDSNAHLRANVFAEKRRFDLAPDASAGSFDALPIEKSVTMEDSIRPEMKVDDMLASAEGLTGVNKSAALERKFDETVTGFTPAILGGLMGAFAILLAWHDLEKFATAWEKHDFMPLLREPTVIVGVADIVFAVLLLLWVTEVYPALRVRLAFGAGLLGYLAWSDGEISRLFASIVASVAIFVITLSPRSRYIAGAAATAIAAFVWMFAQNFFS